MKKINFDQYKLPEKNSAPDRERWQIEAVSWNKSLGIIDQKGKKIMFQLFKRDLDQMLSICNYVKETKNVRNPLAYILYEVRRRNKLRKSKKILDKPIDQKLV